MKDARERMDDMLLSMDDMLLNITDVHCLVFVAPRECKRGDGYAGYADTHSPGVYLKQEGHGVSPTAKPNNAMVKLTHDQARGLAAAIDVVAEPSEHGSGSFGRGKGDVPYPSSYAGFVDAWYEALGRRLHHAIKASEDRLTSLRTTRAAITGVAE